jgi:hypothetical protein
MSTRLESKAVRSGFALRDYPVCLSGIVWRGGLRFLHQRERFISALLRPLRLFIFAPGFREVLRGGDTRQRFLTGQPLRHQPSLSVYVVCYYTSVRPVVASADRAPPLPVLVRCLDSLINALLTTVKSRLACQVPFILPLWGYRP